MLNLPLRLGLLPFFELAFPLLFRQSRGLLFLTRDLWDSHHMSECGLELPHSLLRVGYLDIFYLHSHAIRLPRCWRLVKHVPLLLQCGLSDQFIIGQPLSYNLHQGRPEAPSVPHFLIVPVVVPECLLVQITLQMERLDANIGSLDAALQEAPEVLKPVSVNSTANVLNRMVHHLMYELRVKVVVRGERVSIENRIRGHMPPHYAVQGVLLAIGNNFGYHPSTTPQESEDRSLARCAPSLGFLFPFSLRAYYAPCRR